MTKQSCQVIHRKKMLFFAQTRSFPSQLQYANQGFMMSFCRLAFFSIGLSQIIRSKLGRLGQKIAKITSNIQLADKYRAGIILPNLLIAISLNFLLTILKHIFILAFRLVEVLQFQNYFSEGLNESIPRHHTLVSLRESAGFLPPS